LPALQKAALLTNLRPAEKLRDSSSGRVVGYADPSERGGNGGCSREVTANPPVFGAKVGHPTKSAMRSGQPWVSIHAGGQNDHGNEKRGDYDPAA
jgi:hypothetical protein